MKKNIIALAVAATFAAPMVAQAAPTLYGKLDLNLNKTTGEGMSVDSTASRMGVKGSNKLGNGLKAVYKIEFQLNNVADDSDEETLSPRNQYLGLAGGFGVVLMGRHDTPMKMSQPSDLFNDGAADLKKFANGMGMSGAGGEVRAAEVIAYVSPSFSGAKVVIAGVTADTDDDQGITNVVSAALMYGSKKKGLYLAGAYNAWSEDATGGDAATEVRLSAQYKAAGLVASAMYQSFDKTSFKENGVTKTVDGSNIQLQVGYKMGKMMPKIKYSMADYKDKDQGSAFAIGVGYKLAKKTSAYVYLANQDATMVGKGNDAGHDAKKSLVLGMVHNF